MTDYSPNNKHCFIDSNIWLYSFIENQDSNKTNLARALIQKNTVSIAQSLLKNKMKHPITKIIFRCFINMSFFVFFLPEIATITIIDYTNFTVIYKIYIFLYDSTRKLLTGVSLPSNIHSYEYY